MAGDVNGNRKLHTFVTTRRAHEGVVRMIGIMGSKLYRIAWKSPHVVSKKG